MRGIKYMAEFMGGLFGFVIVEIIAVSLLMGATSIIVVGLVKFLAWL